VEEAKQLHQQQQGGHVCLHISLNRARTELWLAISESGRTAARDYLIDLTLFGNFLLSVYVLQ